MSAQICRLDENAKQLLDEENKVTDAMHLVHRNTYKSLCAVEQVKALAEQLAEE